MYFAGYQPLSLLDYPGVISAILFTQGCPFRCVYCHNPELIPITSAKPESLLTEEHILQELTKRKHIVEGVCITGGEPTIHQDLPAFIKKLKALGFLVKLDTNGLTPTMVQQLVDEKLVDYIAMDIKHTWERYAEVIKITQKQVINNCKKTFQIIQQSSIPHEFRTTVYSGLHAEKDLLEIADQLLPGDHYAMQEIRYKKMLDPTIPRTTPLDLYAIADTMRRNHPHLAIEVRA